MPGNWKAPRLVETVRTVHDGEDMLFLHGSSMLRVRGHPDWLTDTVTALTEGTYRPGSARGLRLLRELDELGWITEEPRRHLSDSDRHSRQVGYLTMFGPDGAAMQARLGEATVALIGLGGIGSVAAQHLAAVGIGRLIGVDHDRVAEHNLNRQLLYQPDDVGKRKTIAARERIAAQAPRVKVEVVNRRIRTPEDLASLPEEPDIVLIGADEPGDLEESVWAWCADSGAAMIRAAVGHEQGYWGPLVSPRAGHCSGCFQRHRRNSLTAREKSIEDRRLPPTPWSFGPSNTIVATWATHDVVRFLACGRCPTLNRRAQVNFLDGTLSYLDGVPCRCRTSPTGEPALRAAR